MKYLYSERYNSKYRIGDKEIACYSRGGIKSEHPDGNYTIAGELFPDSAGAKRKAIDTVALGSKEIQVYKEGSHPRLFYRKAGYIMVGEGEYLLLLKRRWLLLWILFGLLAIAIGLTFYFQKEPLDPPKPPDVTEVTEDTVFISIPSGRLEFRTVSDFTDYNGGNLSVYLEHGGQRDLIHKQTIRIVNGTIESGMLDFLSLTFELTPGDYEGTVVLTAPDGKTAEFAFHVLVRSSKTGRIEINYSDSVTVDRSAGEVSLRYEHGKGATHDAILQVIIEIDGAEYLLAQSETIRAGESVTLLPLAKGSRSDLKPGKYEGLLRLYLVSGNDITADTATDMAVHITVN